MASWRDERVMPIEKKRNKAELKVQVSGCTRLETRIILQRKDYNPISIVIATLNDRALVCFSDEKEILTKRRPDKLCSSVEPQILGTKITDKAEILVTR